MESDSLPCSLHREHSKDTTISACVWKLRRYGRFLPEGNVSNIICAWKIFESSESAGQLELNILGSGHLLGSQGHGLMVRLYENTQDLASDQ
ncbi:meiotic recombination protein REC114-like [Cyprinus carpio]|uniref:Meiotic recombination protein REC114-like n=1 Tax=Cyprinus carpio TaxID=7962 RepID=A0A9R0AJA8_CYPCA|nr:meiotic recombination protein REC114-like [Cyprinus carpio]